MGRTWMKTTMSCYCMRTQEHRHGRVSWVNRIHVSPQQSTLTREGYSQQNDKKAYKKCLSFRSAATGTSLDLFWKRLNKQALESSVVVADGNLLISCVYDDVMRNNTQCWVSECLVVNLWVGKYGACTAGCTCSWLMELMLCKNHRNRIKRKNRRTQKQEEV